MPRLKNRLQSPVNGFQFTQAETGREFTTWDFASICREIQAHRLQNPRFKLATDMQTIENEVDRANAQRMLSIQGADYMVLETEGIAANFPFPRSARGAAAGVRNIIGGVHVLKSWLGDGGEPVSVELSEKRAAVCADCPSNTSGDLTAIFTKPAAELILNQLKTREGMKMTTGHDAKLNFCAACGCVLKLKVHVPMEHIVEGMTTEVKDKLDPRCWVLSELKT